MLVTSCNYHELQRLQDPVTLGELAAHAHVSVPILTRRFRAETGLSPLHRLLRQRIERARELLKSTDLPLDEVAQHSGLGTADSLWRHALLRLGVTPTAYRAAFSPMPEPGR